MFDSMDFDASVESAQWDVLACATHDCFHDGARGFDCDLGLSFAESHAHDRYDHGNAAHCG